MITPLDIQKKQFSKSLRGLNEKEVQSFLQEVFQTLEKHINDNADLKEKMTRNLDEVQKYKNIEKTLSETLVVAKRTADDLTLNARKEADQIVAQAKLQAKAIEEQSKRDLHNVQSQRMMMEKDLEGFRLRMEGLLRAQLDVVGHYKSDIAIPAPVLQKIETPTYAQIAPQAAPQAAPQPTPQAVPQPEPIIAAQSEPPMASILETEPEVVEKPTISEFTQAQLDLSKMYKLERRSDNSEDIAMGQESVLRL